MKAAPGEPILISWDDAITIFHEFGHALHDLNSSVTYPTQAGTNNGGASEFVQTGLRLTSEFYFAFQLFEPAANDLVTPIHPPAPTMTLPGALASVA